MRIFRIFAHFQFSPSCFRITVAVYYPVTRSVCRPAGGLGVGILFNIFEGTRGGGDGGL